MHAGLSVVLAVNLFILDTVFQRLLYDCSARYLCIHD